MRIAQVWAIVFLFSLAGLSRAEDPIEEVVQQTYPFALDGTLSVQSSDGSIMVYGGEKPELNLRATKKAYTAERLKSIAIEVEATQNLIQIKTKIPAKKHALDFSDRSGTVDYVLVVPMKTKISILELANGEIFLKGLRSATTSAQLTNGWLTVLNCFTNLNLRIANGRLDLTYTWWERTHFVVDVRGESATLRAFLPPDPSFAVNSEARSGHVRDSFGLGTRKTAPNSPEINLRTERGDIEIGRSY